MIRRVRDSIEVGNSDSLDALIHTLEAIRDELPPDSRPELRIRGDERRGQRMTIAYSREQTPQEAESDTGFVSWLPPGDDPLIEELRRQLEGVPFDRRQKHRGS
jgi:hypothetical protein